jgi:hypothetical protein
MWRIRVVCWISKVTRAQAHARSLAPTPTPTYTLTHTCTRMHPPARAHTPTHTHTHPQIGNNSCFSTATVISWTRLSVTLYVHWLSGLKSLQANSGIIIQIRPRALSSTFCVNQQPTIQGRAGLLNWHGMPDTCCTTTASQLTLTEIRRVAPMNFMQLQALLTAGQTWRHRSPVGTWTWLLTRTLDLMMRQLSSCVAQRRRRGTPTSGVSPVFMETRRSITCAPTPWRRYTLFVDWMWVNASIRCWPLRVPQISEYVKV